MNIERIFSINISETLDSTCKVLMELHLNAFLEKMANTPTDAGEDIAS